MKQRKKLNKVEAYREASKILNDLYKTDNGKRFVHHLIYSFNKKFTHFIPFCKTTLFDCLSKSELDCLYPQGSDIPVEVSELANELKKDNPIEGSQSKLDSILTTKVKSENLSRVAIRSNETNRIIGLEELQALNDFIEDQLKKRNKIIYEMLRHLNGKSELNSMTEDIKMKSSLEALLNKYKK